MLVENQTENARVLSLIINGTAREFQHVHNVAELVAAMRLTGKRIAIELNGQIVARSRYNDEQLADGDKLEVVVAVGGG